MTWRSFPALDLHVVLRAALECFGRKGFHGATIRDIAAEAGLGVPTLYQGVEEQNPPNPALSDEHRAVTSAAWTYR